MKKTLIIIVIVILILALVAIILYTYIKDTSYDCIVECVTMEEAVQIAETSSNCYIVEFCHGATGARYNIAYGEYAGSDVELIGDYTPSVNLSGVFSYADNKFLIYYSSTLNDDKLGQFNTDPFYEDCFTLQVEDWYPISPVQRQYQFRDYQKGNLKSRLFYPRDCIDEFDLINHDYIPG